MHITKTLLILVMTQAAALVAQPAPDTTRALLAAGTHLRALGARSTPLWPGFRPDTIPIVLVLPGRGTALFNWPGPLPNGWTPQGGIPGAGWRDSVEMGATNTNIRLAGRPAAQAVVPTLSPEVLASLAAHEAFHVFERANARRDRRFGSAENLFYLSRYPIFDLENETAFALEGRILSAALQAGSAEQRRTLAREFVAVRNARHARLPAEIATLEDMAELNEGLAEYVQLRVLDILAREGDRRTRGDAARERASRIERVGRLTEDLEQSIRLRYYASGSAIALLLDRLDGDWKATLMRDDLALDEALGRAVGSRTADVTLRANAERRFGASAIAQAANARLAQLATRRKAQADAALAAPGLVVVLDAAGVDALQPCGFDPQNLLRVGPSMELHTRWLKVCGAGVTAELETKVVHDEAARRYTAVLADTTRFTVSAEGERRVLRDGERLAALHDVVIQGAAVSMKLTRATLERSGRTLHVRLLPDDGRPDQGATSR